MADFPVPAAAPAWVLRKPLTDQWVWIDPDERGPVLAFWIRASETDAWTRDQLRALFVDCMDTGKIPEALQAWANDDYTGRLSPIQRGPKTDYASDYRIMAAVEIRKLFFDEKDHPARRAVAEERNPKCPQYGKVRGAHERGKRWPPGFWSNSG